MSIVRVDKREHPFVQIDKRCLEDPRLSWKTKGILAYLLSRPDDWVVRFEQLQNVSTDGKSSIRSAFKELTANGYCKKVTKQAINDEGRSVLMGSEYIVYEVPESRQPETSDAKDARGSENLTVRQPRTTNNEILTNNELPISKKTNRRSVFVEKAKQLKETVDLWNETYGTDLRITEKKKQQLNARLKNFTIEEIHKAILNRAENEWLKGDGHAHRGNWDALFRNDERVEKYLNAEKPKQESSKPFYGFNMPREMY